MLFPLAISAAGIVAWIWSQLYTAIPSWIDGKVHGSLFLQWFGWFQFQFFELTIIFHNQDSPPASGDLHPLRICCNKHRPSEGTCYFDDSITLQMAWRRACHCHGCWAPTLLVLNSNPPFAVLFASLSWAWEHFTTPSKWCFVSMSNLAWAATTGRGRHRARVEGADGPHRPPHVASHLLLGSALTRVKYWHSLDSALISGFDSFFLVLILILIMFLEMSWFTEWDQIGSSSPFKAYEVFCLFRTSRKPL